MPETAAEQLPRGGDLSSDWLGPAVGKRNRSANPAVSAVPTVVPVVGRSPCADGRFEFCVRQAGQCFAYRAIRAAASVRLFRSAALAIYSDGLGYQRACRGGSTFVTSAWLDYAGHDATGAQLAL
jgi:hypothetical protein